MGFSENGMPMSNGQRVRSLPSIASFLLLWSILVQYCRWTRPRLRLSALERSVGSLQRQLTPKATDMRACRARPTWGDVCSFFWNQDMDSAGIDVMRKVEDSPSMPNGPRLSHLHQGYQLRNRSFGGGCRSSPEPYFHTYRAPTAVVVGLLPWIL